MVVISENLSDEMLQEFEGLFTFGYIASTIRMSPLTVAANSSPSLPDFGGIYAPLGEHISRPDLAVLLPLMIERICRSVMIDIPFKLEAFCLSEPKAGIGMFSTCEYGFSYVGYFLHGTNMRFA